MRLVILSMMMVGLMSSAHAAFTKSDSVKKIEAFVKDTLMNKTIVCPEDDYKINKKTLINRMSQKITFAAFNQSERGFGFTTINDVKSRVFAVDSEGNPVGAGTDHSQVQSFTHMFNESQALKGALVGMAFDPNKKVGYTNLRIVLSVDGITLYSATALMEDLFDSTKGWRAGSQEVTNTYRLVGETVELTQKIIGFDADISNLRGAAASTLKLTKSDEVPLIHCKSE